MNEMKKSFAQVTNIIETAKKNTYRKANEELIKMYWFVGQYLSEESSNAS